MAYGIRYTASWRSKDKYGTLFISQKDYVGASEALKLQFDAITLTKQLESWESHIIGDVCEFNIINDKANYFTLLDLMIATERKYKVTVNCSVETGSAPEIFVLFNGFINTEVVTQKYLKSNIIHLVASSFVSKLENVYPESLDAVSTVTFIDIIHEILEQAGNSYPIRVASPLISSNSVYDVNKTFMNQNGVNNEIFWENNVDRVDSKTILEQILTAFQCYIYFWDAYWYIEGFDVLFNSDRVYVEYNAGQSYSPADSGDYLIIAYDTKDVHDLVFTEMSQTLSVIPGNRTVQVRINQQPYYNLTVNSFLGIVKVGDPVPVPPVREWRAYQPMTQTLMKWDAHGEPYKTMVNSIHRTSTYTNLPSHENADDYIYLDKGLYTTIVVTHDGNSELSIKWKYSCDFTQLSSVLYSLEKAYVAFRWELQILTLAGTFVGSVYYDTDDSIWRLDNQGVGNYTYVEVSEFNVNTMIADIDINIPLPEVKDYSEIDELLAHGDYKMVLIIRTESINVRDANSNFIHPSVYYGDVQISASISTFDENIIEGITNTDFLKKTTVEVDVADVPNYNYKNGVLEGNSLDRLTSLWHRNEMTGRKLVDYILIDKFRTGNISRQQLTGRINSIELLRPLSMFTDSKQSDKQFLLTGFVFDVNEDMYEITLNEYDNTTPVNLIEI